MYGAKVITVHETGNVDVVYDTAGEDEEKGVHGEWVPNKGYRRWLCDRHGRKPCSVEGQP